MQKLRNRLATLVTMTVVAIGAFAAGYLIYQHSADKTAASLTASTLSSTQQAISQQTPAVAQTVPTVTYLHVKEWGVKLPLSASVKDAYYVIDPSSWKDPDGLPSEAFLGLKSLSGTDCNPANNTAGKRGAVGAILRIPPTEIDQVTGRALRQEYPSGITVGSYYYAYQSWASNNPCGTATALQPFDTSFAGAAKQTTSATTTTN